MIDAILFSLWFFLPAGLANLVPVIFARLPIISKWNTPIDFNKKLNDMQIFGSNKTWRGLIGGILVSILIVVWQLHVFNSSSFIQNLSLSYGVDYTQLNPILLGGLLGFGALMGDAIESFFKRQIGVKPGDRWFPFDQIDYILGGCIASAFVVILPLTIYITILLVWFLMHLLVSYIGFKIKLKDKPI